MQQGAFVRHRRMPEWGIGRVVSVDSHCHVQFESHGLAKFPIDGTETHLEIVSEAAVPADHPLRGSGKKASGSKQASAAPCEHCDQSLTRSVYNQGKTLKSCPHCSHLDGHVHIFYEYPDGFGMSEARENPETPDGTQSYCKACRQKLPGTGGRRCQDVTRT